MAKFENNIDIIKVVEFAEKNKTLLHKNISKEVQQAYDKFTAEKNSKVYIFSKSIAFRIGKSSIKTVDGFKDGFKSSFVNSNDEIFRGNSFSGNSKLSKVIHFSLLACLLDSSRVLSEEDKSERAESEETLRTTNQIKDLIDSTGADYLTIVMGEEEFKVDGFRQISGRPKADMAFTYKNKDIIYVSHKLGSKPADFQQYGGFASDLGMENNSRTKFSSHLNSAARKEIKEFLEGIDLILEKKYKLLPNNGLFDLSKTAAGTNFSIPIKSKTIAEVCMFGKDFGKTFGLDNVHILIDGNIEFRRINAGIYELDGSFHRTYNPNLNGVKNELSNLNSLGQYQPMLMIMRSASQGLKNGGFLNARGVVWPRNKISDGYYQKYINELKTVSK
jgi:hypothetical protein